MEPSEESLWQWVLGMAATACVAGIGWALAAVSIKADHEIRIKHLEDGERERALRCDKQRSDILEELRKEVCSIVKDAIGSLKEQHSEKLSSMDKNLALISQAQNDTKEKIEDIFNRLNRRTDGHPRAVNERRQV